MPKEDRQFSLNYERLKRICLKAYNAYVEGRGVFKEIDLPQWALPLDLEYNPKRIETPFPEEAAKYLFVMASMEKMALSKQNIKNGIRTWQNTETRWIFNPLEVAKRSLNEVRQVTQGHLRYNINNFPSGFLYNNQLIAQEFQGSPRSIVQGQSVEEARKRLMQFKGIATGISNLYILYLTDRKIAEITNPEERMIKVDIHKARVPTNTDAVVPKNGFIRRDVIVPTLEAAYLQICREENLNPGILDGALWLIGSKVCVKKDISRCVELCPLEKLCTSCVREDKVKGVLIVHEDGKRVETRRGVHQYHLDVGLYQRD